MTQIQPLAEPLPPGPSTSQASGGKVRGSRGRGGNSPGASHLPEQCPAGHHVHQLSLRLWSMDFVSCRDRQETATHKLLTQQMRTIDNSRAPVASRSPAGCHPHRGGHLRDPIAASTLPLSHTPWGIILGHIPPPSHDKNSSANPSLPASCSLPTTSLLSFVCFP